MTRKSILFNIGAVVVAAAFLLSPAASIAAAEVQWQPLDFGAAGAKAAAESKLIYVFIEGDNCPPCDEFKKTHVPDPAFIDFVNTFYVPIKVHEGNPEGDAFISMLHMRTESVVPRFYVFSPDGRGLSTYVGLVVVSPEGKDMAPPMGAAYVLKNVMGKDLPIDKAAAAATAGRLTQSARSLLATKGTQANQPARYLGVAVLATTAWALAGRLDEAERVLGAPWAEHLLYQEIREWYIEFWLAWGRNLPGALTAAKAYHAVDAADQNGIYMLAKALAANGDFAGAAREGEKLVVQNPDNQFLLDLVGGWRRQAGQ